MSETSLASGRELAATDTFPLSEMQKYMLPALTDPAAALCFRRFFNFAEGIRIKPGVSPRRVERGLKKLVKRHDSLRLAFRKTEDDDWRAVLLPQDAVTLQVIDHGDVSDAEMREIIRGVEHETIEIDAECLTDFRMLRFGELGDVILIRMHHALTDAFGFMVLVEDLLRLAINLPIMGKGYSYGDFLKSVEQELPDHDGEHGAYWDKLLDPPPAPVNFGRVAKGLPVTDFHLISDIRDVVLPLEEEAYESLLDITKDADASLYTLTVASLTEVMHDLYGADEILGKSVLGRSSGKLSNFMGFCLRFPVFRSGLKDGDTLLDRAKALRNQMRESIGHITKELSRPESQVDAQLRAANDLGLQFFVHVPAAEARAKQSMFASLFRARGGTMIQVGPVEVERMHLPRPQAMGAPNDLTVLMVPANDGAQLILRCDASVFDDGELEDMAKRIMEKLLSVRA